MHAFSTSTARKLPLGLLFLGACHSGAENLGSAQPTGVEYPNCEVPSSELSLPLHIEGASLLAAWQRMPTLSSDCQEQLFRRHLRTARTPEHEWFNFPDFGSGEYRSSGRFSGPAGQAVVLFVVWMPSPPTGYAGLAVYDHDSFVDQLFVGGVEGGTGVTYSRTCEVNAAFKVDCIDRAVGSGAGAPASKDTAHAYRLALDGHFLTDTKK